MSGETFMKTRYAAALAAIAGVALGALAVRSLQAQGAPPAYVVGEVDVVDQASYDKEYVPAAMKAIADGGGKYLARGGATATLYGVPPKRIVIIKFESLEKAQATFNSPTYREAKTAGDRFANFRIYAVEGLPQ